MDGLIEGGEKRKSQFREHGKDEHWHHCEFNEGNLENKALYVSCTKKKTRTTTQWPTEFVRVIVVLSVCAPLGPYGGVNTVTYPGHLIQIRR